jgi:uncharacterized membrane protein
MTIVTLPDLVALAWFIDAWIGYSPLIEKTAAGRNGLNALMNTYRDQWMERLLARDMRMVDARSPPRCKTAPHSLPPPA